MQITERVAQFVVNTGWECMPGSVIECAKKALLDTLGVAIAGSTEPAGKTIKAFVRKIGTKPQAGVIGGGFRTDAPLAALANGTMAHALEFDDSAEIQMPLHPSVPVMPVALALGESIKASGRDILHAYILGVEVETKVAAAMSISHYTKGWNPTATLGTLGAVSAAAKLLGLNVEQTMAALGIACSFAGGLRQNAGTMTKPLHAGNAAKNGIVAAELAKLGWSADRDILEAPVGFVQIFGGEGEFSLEEAVSRLGNPFHFAYPGVGIKIYPSCNGTYAPIEAMRELMEKHQIPAQEVKNVECGVPGLGIEGLIRPDAKTGLEGKFSIEHCLAAMLLDKRIGLRQFSEERMRDPEVAKLRHKVRVYAHPDLWDGEKRLDYFAAIVAVKLIDGSEYSYNFKKMKSDLGSPQPWGVLTAKFNECAQLALPQNVIEKLIAYIRRLEYLKDVSEVVDLALG